MSFPAQSNYPPVDQIAPDADQPVYCAGCKRLVVQISNQAIYLTFGQGPQGSVIWDPNAEPYLPLVGVLDREFDAFKFRAYTPAAQLPAGQAQAQVKLTPLATDTAGAGDSLQPNVLTVNPDGTIGAQFTGTVSAHGFKFYDDTYGFVYSLSSARPASNQPVWTLVGPLWSHGKQLGLTWGQAKAIAGGSWITFRKYVIAKLGL